MRWRRLLAVSLVGLLLVDLPVLLVALVASLRYGFADTITGVYEWRSSHPSTYAVSVALLLIVAYRRRRTS